MASKTKEELREEIAVITADRDSERAAKDAIIAEKEDKRPFEAIAERIGKTNKFLLVIPSLNYSAQLYKRDNDTLISTKEYVHSEEETNSNEDVRAICDRKVRNDALATQKNVASQGDVPSAS